MHQQSNEKRRRAISTLAVVASVLLVILATSLSSRKRIPVDTATYSTTIFTTPTPMSIYRDGTYTAIGSYDSPGGTERLTVEVTLQDGVITSTSAQPGASDSESATFEAQFISGYKQLIIGKNIADVSLSRVSGSSLTSQGFNDALEQIKKQAQ